MNILLVARDPVLTEFLRRPLEPLGHRLVAVDSVDTMREMIEDVQPEAVLLPRRLPDASVAAAIGVVRGEAWDEGDIATIVIGLQPGDRDIARDVDADGFLLVPFADAEVLDVIGATTRTKQLVLLVDDSQMIHRHTVPLLIDEGYEVVSAEDGAEGLKLARSRMPDLIITDIEMPKIDGYELCKTLKEDEDTAHIPVLIASSLGEVQDLERGFDCGADDYLIKPVIPEELITRVRHLCSSPGGREETILVVDDSPAQRHYVEDCLARQGFNVTTAEDGRVGLEKARLLRPSLIVSDYEMPEMTGFELVHALKRDPETRNIPVVMLTARDSKRDMAQLRAAGATAYLVKPFAQDKCIATVERTLAERQLLDYKAASAMYISDAARRAAEQRARDRDIAGVRAKEVVMAVLFSDIVGFTKMSAQLSAREVVDLLNDYFDQMCPLIKARPGGDIDKFIGDAIMGLFDDQKGTVNPSEQAVRAALQMQEQMAAFNANHPIQLAMRIGINTGTLIHGDLGAGIVRRDHTVIGDTVNRANRHEMLCPTGRVLISESTRDAIADIIEVEEMSGLHMKGVDGGVTAYVVTSIAPAKEIDQ